MTADFDKQREYLNTLSKEELIDYIIDLFRQNQDLMAEHIEFAGAIDKSETIELENLREMYRDMAERCFHVYEKNPYHVTLEVEKKLDNLMDKASTLAKEDKKSAVVLLTAIFESIDDNYGKIDDSDGGLAAISEKCIEELSALLPETALKPVERQKWQQRMFNRYVKNDYGIADGVDCLLIETFKQEDLDFLEKIVTRELKKFAAHPDWDNNYMKTQLAKFLAELYKTKR